MNRQTIATAIPLIAVMLIAGCVGSAGQTTEPQPAEGKGLVITDFSAVPSDLRSAMRTAITLTVENQGDQIAYKTRGLGLLLIPNEWNPDINNANWKIQGYGKDLSPADSVTGRPADTQMFKWNAVAPSLPRGQSFTYTITGRVYYDYTTTSRGIIPVYPYGEASPQTATFTSSNGPLQIEVQLAPNPPIVENDSDTFSMNIIITNVGGGNVYKSGLVGLDSLANSSTFHYDISESDRNVVNLSWARPIGLHMFDESCLNGVELVGDKAVALCDVVVEKKPYAVQPYQISIYATYGYYTEKPISVTVSGK